MPLDKLFSSKKVECPDCKGFGRQGRHAPKKSCSTCDGAGRVDPAKLILTT
jgi:DnaJ-class molecular chaperone